MKKKFVTPNCEFIIIDVKDIITTSPADFDISEETEDNGGIDLPSIFVD